MGREEDAPPDFVCQLEPAQADAFSQQAETVCAAGRPVCPLCGEPIEGGSHACVRANGHTNQPLPEPEQED